MYKKNLYLLTAAMLAAVFSIAYAKTPTPTVTISGNVYNQTQNTLYYSPRFIPPGFHAPAQQLAGGANTSFSASGTGSAKSEPLYFDFEYVQDPLNPITNFCEMSLSYDFDSNHFFWGAPYCVGNINGSAAGTCGEIAPNHYACNFEIYPAQSAK